MRNKSSILKHLGIILIVSMMIAISFLGFSEKVLGIQEPLSFQEYLYNVWVMIWDTLWVFMLIYIISIIFVIPILMLDRSYQNIFSSFLSGLRSLPSIAWLPISIAIIGSIWSNWALFWFVTLGTTPLVLAHMVHGLSTVNEEKLIIARLSGASKIREIFHIVFPDSIIELFQAMRYGIALAFILVVIRDQFMTNVGSGGYQMIINMIEISDYTLLDNLIGTIVLASSGIILDQLVQVIEKGSFYLLTR